MSVARPLALITGGMRRVGAHIAMKLAGEGYDLALSSHVESEMEPELAEILAASGGDWRGFLADLSDPAAAQRLLDEAATHFGRVPDLLVNNAGMFGQEQWPEMSLETLEAHFRLNL